MQADFNTVRRSRARSVTHAHAVLALIALVACGCGSDEAQNTQVTAEYAIWAASPQAYDEMIPFPDALAPEPLVFSDQTLRQIVRVSSGGEQVRVHFSNLFGPGPLTINGAQIAYSQGDGRIDSATNTELLFDGDPGVTIAAGEEAWSDFAPLEVMPEADLAISLYLAGETPVDTVHALAQQTAYVASGNALDAEALPEAETLQSYYWISRVNAGSTTSRRVLVAFGDSITDGFNSTVDAARRYPDFLSHQLLADPGSTSVVNAGISGNRVLNEVIGPSGMSRFGRDVLNQAGATGVIILLGINDIGFGSFSPEQAVDSNDITSGLGGLIDEAKAEGLNVYLGTLLPFEGAGYYSDEGERTRQEVNAWIRDSQGVDGVIDFDEVMRDPSNPGMLLPAYDSGDALHPNDEGYEAMAAAADTALAEF